MPKSELKPNIKNSPFYGDDKKEAAAMRGDNLMIPDLDKREVYDAETGDLTHVWQPASLPMTSVSFDPPLRVKALKTFQHPRHVKKGDTYYAHAVYQTGTLLLSKSLDNMAEAIGLYPMAHFVQLLKQPVRKEPEPQLPLE